MNIFYFEIFRFFIWLFAGARNNIISGEAAQVKERTRAGNFKKLLLSASEIW